MIFFDIETKPRPDLVEKFTEPYPDFNPDEVKYGNTKDEEKRIAIRLEAERKHIHEERVYWANARDRAALNPLTGEVLAIGTLEDYNEGGGTNPVHVIEGSERDVLCDFWTKFAEEVSQSFVFWSGNGSQVDNFDIDFLVRRTWYNGLKVPAAVFRGRYFSDRIVDATSRYVLNRRDAYCSLTNAANQLGLYERHAGHIFPKTHLDKVKGENFHEFFTSDDPAKKALAYSYLNNDLHTLRFISKVIL